MIHKKILGIAILTLLGTAIMIFCLPWKKSKSHLDTVQEKMDLRVELGYNTALSAAYLDNSSTQFLHSGNNINEDSPFEIASITKSFTAHLAVILHREGKVDLFKNVDVVDLPITLYDLLTFSSGIRDPGPSKYFNPETGNTVPVADYTVKQAIQYCQETGLGYPPGTKQEYSNLSYAIAALELERASNEPFEKLLRDKILLPLKMDKTGFHIPPIQGTAYGVKAPPWKLKELSGFSGLVSCASDLAKYLRYLFLTDEDETLSQDKALLLALIPKLKHPYPNMQNALGWILETSFEDQIFGQTGRSLGFSCYIGYSRKQHKAAILLTNANTNDNLGRYILNERYPLLTMKKSLLVEDSDLKRYEGKYSCKVNEEMIHSFVSSKDNKLFIVFDREAPIPLFPEKKNLFFPKSFDNYDESIAFQEDEDGKITGFEVLKKEQPCGVFKRLYEH